MKIPPFVKPIFEVSILGAGTLAGRDDGHGNKRPLLGRFQYSDGHVEEVHEQGRYNLLIKVPDVHIVGMVFNNKLAKSQWLETVKANKTGYGKSIVKFIEDWAIAMDIAIANGESVSECAERTMMQANSSVTGGVVGMAVGTLKEVWVHGAELSVWNKHSMGSD